MKMHHNKEIKAILKGDQGGQGAIVRAPYKARSFSLANGRDFNTTEVPRDLPSIIIEENINPA